MVNCWNFDTIKQIKNLNFRIAALMHKTDGYFCGGTLYTKRLVVTGEYLYFDKTIKNTKF